MDLKFKAIPWVGNICQKFEAICHGVDNMVSQESVKYVGNHVQTGCESMKRFCSDVVQELLPSSVDHVEREIEDVPLDQNNENGSYIKSLIGIDENVVDFDAKQLQVNPDPFDPGKNPVAHQLSSSGLRLEGHELLPSSVDPVEHEAEDVPLEQNDENGTHIKSVIAAEENLVDTDVIQLPVDQDAINPAKNPVAHGLSFGGTHFEGQKLLPSPVDSVVHEAEEVLLEQNDGSGAYAKPLIDNEENLLDMGVRELLGDLDATDPVKNPVADELSFIGLHLVDELSSVPSMNSVEGNELSLSLGKNNNVPRYKNLDVGFEENSEKASSPEVLLNSHDKTDTFLLSLPSESMDESHENMRPILTEVSPARAVHDEGLEYHDQLGNNCGDEAECCSDCLTIPLSSELVFSVESCQNKAPACSVFGERSQSLPKKGTNSSNSADETEPISGWLTTPLSPGLGFSIESCENKAPACSFYVDSSQSVQRVRTTSSNSANETECIFDHLSTSFSPEFSVESCENKAHVFSLNGELQPLRKPGMVFNNYADEMKSASGHLCTLLSPEMAFSVESFRNKTPGCSVHGEGLQFPKKQGTTCGNTTDETDYVSDPFSTLLSSESAFLVESCMNKIPTCSVHHEGFQFSKILETVCSNSADETEYNFYPLSTLLSSELECSVKSCENKAPVLGHAEGIESPQKWGTTCGNHPDEMECISDHFSTLLSTEHPESSSSLSTEAYHPLKLSPTKSHLTAENICHPVEDAPCVPVVPSSLPSFDLVQTVPCPNRATETGLALFCNVDSNGLRTSRLNDTLPQSMSSGNKYEQPAQLEAFMVTSEIGRSDDSGDDFSSMDTIELSDKVDLGNSCVLVDNKELYAVSRRLRKLRSYRKRIQDAFTSKKRRAKEYEQLAIWYGDTEDDCSQFSQNLFPPTNSKRLPIHEHCDSEWELL